MPDAIAQPSSDTATAIDLAKTVARQRSTPALTRGRILQWLRAAHVWLGLAGAVLGFTFGLSGFLLNHRSTLKIPIERAEVTQTQVMLSQPMATAEDLAKWLSLRAGLPGARANIRTERANTVLWRGQPAQQAERWTVNLNTTKVSVSAKYAAGSSVVDLETQDATVLGLLMRLHTGSGASVVWILLADMIAAAFMVLTLTGVMLWSKLRTPRLLGIAVLVAAPLVTAVYLTTL